MYIFQKHPAEAEVPAWIERSLRVGDCFDSLLRNKAEHCGEVFRVLEGYGIDLRDDGTYILLQFDAAETWVAHRLLGMEADPLIDDIFLIFEVFPMHLFTSCGGLYGLIAMEAPGSDEGQTLSACCTRLIEARPETPLRILISQEEPGRQGIFHAANTLRHGMDYARFFHDLPSVCFLQLSSQTSLDCELPTKTYGKLAATLAERLGNADFHADQMAGMILAQLKAHSSYSMESLHMQMQRLSMTLLSDLTENSVIDQQFLQQNRIAQRLMFGDSEEAYLENLTGLLELLHRRRMEIEANFNMELLRRVRAYTLQNIDSMALSVSQIAERFRQNRSQLTAQFRDYYGVSLAQFIQRQRLERALLLIEAHPDRPLAQIAAEAGYCNISTMFRAFRKQGLQTPAAYRPKR